jgi:hypothetical protein
MEYRHDDENTIFLASWRKIIMTVGRSSLHLPGKNTGVDPIKVTG